MPRLALLLRGINVGGNNKVAMSDLKALLGDLGYSDVTTLLNSGNAVVTTDDLPGVAERRVEDAITASLGLQIATIARSHGELADIVAANPFASLAPNPAHYVVAFLREEPPADALAAVNPEQYEEKWHLLGRELYIWYPSGQAKTKLTNTFWEKHVRVPATARNWNTVTKLSDLTAPR